MDERAERYSAIGGLLQNKPVICGGGHDGYQNVHSTAVSQDYFILGTTHLELQMLEKRKYAASIVLNEQLWITGGGAGGLSLFLLGTTEFISLNQPPVQGPKLPFTIANHTMVQVNSETIYIIGGKQNGLDSNKTWIVDPTDNFKIREGPTLKNKRCGHFCNKMKINGKVYIVVAGGYVERDFMDTVYGDMLLYYDSVEILDTAVPELGWFIGMNYEINIPFFV